MYGALWRLLPGHRAGKLATAGAIVLGVVALLWYLVFPWVEPKIQFDHGTVQSGGASESGAPATPGHSRHSPAP